MASTMNYSIYAIPAAWVVAFIPHLYSVHVMSKAKVYDPRSPRTLLNIVEKDQRIDKRTKERIIRSRGAHSNGIENLAFFAAAVIAGNVAKLPTQTLNSLSVGYVLNRFVYNFVYINNSTRMLAGVRAVLFTISIGQIVTLFIKSGNALQG